MKNRKILISALGIVVALVFGIVVAYAALSSTLNAKFNSVTVGNATWDVGFSTDITGNTKPGTPGGVNMDKISCGQATISKNSVTIDSFTLPQPGDKCSYGFEVKNSGNITAKLSSIIANEPDGITCEKSESEDAYTMVCGNVTYRIHADSYSLYSKIQYNNWFYIDVTYTENDSSTILEIQDNPGFTFVFGQA